jgi:hypothetical protein
MICGERYANREIIDVKIVLHWILFILRVLFLLIFLPVWLLYVWVRWRISRAAFIRAANAAGMGCGDARKIAGVFNPASVMREGGKSIT